MSKNIFLIPSMACQASCAYCFGPNAGGSMTLDLAQRAVEWLIAMYPDQETFTVTFHGGEPLLAGYEWYSRLLPELNHRFRKRIRLSIQSNLWLLDDAFCDLFQQYSVSLGTSLDGPESITDTQRCPGYFSRTMNGIETARKHGLNVGCICTFSQYSAVHWKEIQNFFHVQSLEVNIHPVVKKLNGSNENNLSLSPQEYANLCLNLLDIDFLSPGYQLIFTFKAMARSIAARSGSLCTFCDCLGKYLAVTPNGNIYPCTRFANSSEWSLGNLAQKPRMSQLMQNDAWMRLSKQQEACQRECEGCPHFVYCNGGCAYQAISTGSAGRDPYCLAYRHIFDRLTQQALQEVFSQENIQEIIESPSEIGIMRQGRLIEVMRGKTKPSE